MLEIGRQPVLPGDCSPVKVISDPPTKGRLTKRIAGTQLFSYRLGDQRVQSQPVDQRLAERAITEPFVAVLRITVTEHILQQFRRGDSGNRGDTEDPVAAGVDLITKQTFRQFRRRCTRAGFGTDDESEWRAVAASDHFGDVTVVDDSMTTDQRKRIDRCERTEFDRVNDRIPSAFIPTTRGMLPRSENHDSRIGKIGYHSVTKVAVE